jgi:hypothetical protein
MKTTLSIFAATVLIGTIFLATNARKEAEAQVITAVPFAGKLSSIMVCCNGIQFSLTHPPLSIATGKFIFPWQNMIPIPTIGWGLYSWWSLTPGTTVLGDATPGGVCITIVSECESSQTVQYSVNKMGTNLI